MRHTYRDERGRFCRAFDEEQIALMEEDIEHEAFLFEVEQEGHVHPNVRLNQPCPACERAQL